MASKASLSSTGSYSQATALGGTSRGSTAAAAGGAQPQRASVRLDRLVSDGVPHGGGSPLNSARSISALRPVGPHPDHRLQAIARERTDRASASVADAWRAGVPHRGRSSSRPRDKLGCRFSRKAIAADRRASLSPAGECSTASRRRKRTRPRPALAGAFVPVGATVCTVESYELAARGLSRGSVSGFEEVVWTNGTNPGLQAGRRRRNSAKSTQMLGSRRRRA